MSKKVSFSKHGIVYVCNYAAFYPGNFIPSVLALAKSVSDKHNVFFVFPEAARTQSWVQDILDDFNVVFCNFSSFSLCCTLIKIRHKTIDGLIVHAHFLNCAQITGLKLVADAVFCHLHMTEDKACSLLDRLKQCIKHYLTHGVKFIAVSDSVGEIAKEKYDVVYTVPNAIDFASLNKRQDTSFADFINCLCKPNEYVIAIFGTHFFRKGVDVALAAIDEIREKHPCRLIILAHDIDKTLNLIHESCPFYSQISNSVNVVHVTQYIKSLYDNIDLFISPSRSEAFGYAVVEAAYCKCSVLASDVPGQSMLKSIPNSVWVDADDSHALATAIIKLIQRDSHSLEDMKEEQTKYVVSHYSIQSWVNEINNIYQVECPSF